MSESSPNSQVKKMISFLATIQYAQLSPEIFDPRKMDANFLEANFEYFRLSTASNEKDNENCPSYFLVFGLRSC